LFIGHHRIGGEPVPLYKVLAVEEKCKDRLDKLNIRGGVTLVCEGWYKGEYGGQRIEEPCSIIASLMGVLSEDDWTQIKELASDAAWQLKQESVLVAKFGSSGSEMHYAQPAQMGLDREKSSRVGREEEIELAA